MNNYIFNNEKKTVEREVENCKVILTFNSEAAPDLKKNVLWYLTQCYEDRVTAEAK